MRFSTGVQVLFFMIGLALLTTGLFVLEDWSTAAATATIPEVRDINKMKPEEIVIEAMKQAKLYHELRCFDVKEPHPLAGNYCVDFSNGRQR